jgi:hypothetical protein
MNNLSVTKFSKGPHVPYPSVFLVGLILTTTVTLTAVRNGKVTVVARCVYISRDEC